jgi:hypothetical protein
VLPLDSFWSLLSNIASTNLGQTGLVNGAASPCIVTIADLMIARTWVGATRWCTVHRLANLYEELCLHVQGITLSGPPGW